MACTRERWHYGNVGDRGNYIDKFDQYLFGKRGNSNVPLDSKLLDNIPSTVTSLNFENKPNTPWIWDPIPPSITTLRIALPSTPNNIIPMTVKNLKINRMPLFRAGVIPPSVTRLRFGASDEDIVLEPGSIPDSVTHLVLHQ
eukprot:gene19721-23625_t